MELQSLPAKDRKEVQAMRARQKRRAVFDENERLKAENAALKVSIVDSNELAKMYCEAFLDMCRRYGHI